MRLRLAPVEYKVCATADCGGTYEGERCPHCHAAFDPTRGRKELADRLILVAVDPAMYEQTHRCRCPVCKNLFGLREENVIVRAQCHHCAQPLFSRTQLRMLWKDMDTLLQRARKLERGRRRLEVCPHCAGSIPLEPWCPLARTVPHASEVSGLPQNSSVVWVRTFHSGASLEELQHTAPDGAWGTVSEELTSTLDEEPTDAEQY